MDNTFILSQIFSHLPLNELLLMETVSTSWSDTVSRYWRSVRSMVIADDLFEFGEWYEKEHMEERKEEEISMILRRCGQYLTKLRVASVHIGHSKQLPLRPAPRHNMSERILSTICRYCTNLILLDMSYHRFDTPPIIDLLFNLPISIEILLFDRSGFDKGTSGMELMKAFSSLVNNLKFLSLSGSCSDFKAIDDDCGSNRHSASLTYLNLMGVQSSKIVSLRSWIPNLVNLEQLHVQNPSIDDTDLKILAQTCRGKLRRLSLIMAKNVRDFSLIASCSKLKYLCLDGNEGLLTESAVIQICLQCTGLRHLSVKYHGNGLGSLQADTLRRHMPQRGKFYMGPSGHEWKKLVDKWASSKYSKFY